MASYTFFNLKPLYQSMKANKRTCEVIIFVYNNVIFEALFDIDCSPFELIIKTKKENLAFVININKGFTAELDNKIYGKLCRILDLTWEDDGFSSKSFLSYIDSRIPIKCSKYPTEIEKVISFRITRLTETEKKDGIYFSGWQIHENRRNGHVNEKNLKKTRLLLGSFIHDYCKKYDISSRWTNDDSLDRVYVHPWKI